MEWIKLFDKSVQNVGYEVTTNNRTLLRITNILRVQG